MVASRVLTASSLFLALASGPALAMGGGGMGGGQMPSVSAPQYNAAQEFQLGSADFQNGRFREAATHFEHVTEAQPRVATGWYMLGLARNSAGDVKGASRAFEHSVKLDPDPVDPHRQWAVSLARLKQKDKAQAQLDALKARATACADTCPQAADLKAAIAAIEDAMAQAGAAALAAPPASLLFASQEAGDTAYVRAVSLINERRFPEALASLGEAEKAFGPHPDILTYEGFVWRKLGRLEKAEAYYRQALAVAPRHRGATEYYGELMVVRGDVAGAKRMLARLDDACPFGCAEAEELRAWIDKGGDPAA